jgi:hypothetical protein
MPSGFGHANHPGAFINPKLQRIEVKGLVRSRAGTARTQKNTSPTRSNTLGKKDLTAAESQRTMPCRATAAPHNLRPRIKPRGQGINAAARILFMCFLCLVEFASSAIQWRPFVAQRYVQRRASAAMPPISRPLQLKLEHIAVAVTF